MHVGCLLNTSSKRRSPAKGEELHGAGWSRLMQEMMGKAVGLLGLGHRRPVQRQNAEIKELPGIRSQHREKAGNGCGEDSGLGDEELA